jgi:hypothetical protein
MTLPEGRLREPHRGAVHGVRLWIAQVTGVHPASGQGGNEIVGRPSQAALAQRRRREGDMVYSCLSGALRAR